jgi:hypothetical protein
MRRALLSIFMRLHPRVHFANLARVTFRGNHMEEDDQDLPTAYLAFTIAAIIVIGAMGAGALIILIRN